MNEGALSKRMVGVPVKLTGKSFTVNWSDIQAEKVEAVVIGVAV